MAKYCEACQLEVEAEGKHCPECRSELKIVDSSIDTDDNDFGSNNIDSVISSSRGLEQINKHNIEDFLNYLASTISVKPVLAASVGFISIFLILFTTGSVLDGNSLDWTGFLLFGINGVPVEINGEHAGGLRAGSIAMSMLFLVYVIYSKFNSLGRKENIIGFVAGYLSLTVIAALFLRSGTISIGEQDAVYRVSLLQATLVMGIGVQLLSGTFGSFFSDIRNDSLGVKTTAGYGILSVFLTPYFAPIISVLSGRNLWKREHRSLGVGISGVGIIFGILALIGNSIMFYILLLVGRS